MAAAGNNGDNAKFYPAAYEKAIAVAATTNTDVKAFFSCYGSDWVDIAAPGSYIYSTTPNHNSVLSRNSYPELYAYPSGTSMASPVWLPASQACYGARLTVLMPSQSGIGSIQQPIQLPTTVIGDSAVLMPAAPSRQA